MGLIVLRMMPLTKQLLLKALQAQAKSFDKNTESKGSMPVPGAAPTPAEKPAE
jgi:hypothetical protein